MPEYIANFLHLACIAMLGCGRFCGYYFDGVFIKQLPDIICLVDMPDALFQKAFDKGKGEWGHTPFICES